MDRGQIATVHLWAHPDCLLLRWSTSPGQRLHIVDLHQGMLEASMDPTANWVLKLVDDQEELNTTIGDTFL